MVERRRAFGQKNGRKEKSEDQKIGKAVRKVKECQRPL